MLLKFLIRQIDAKLLKTAKDVSQLKLSNFRIKTFLSLIIRLYLMVSQTIVPHFLLCSAI